MSFRLKLMRFVEIMFRLKKIMSSHFGTLQTIFESQIICHISSCNSCIICMYTLHIFVYTYIGRLSHVTGIDLLTLFPILVQYGMWRPSRVLQLSIVKYANDSPQSRAPIDSASKQLQSPFYPFCMLSAIISLLNEIK